MKQEEILKQIVILQDQLNNLAKEVNKPKKDSLIGKCFKLKKKIINNKDLNAQSDFILSRKCFLF